MIKWISEDIGAITGPVNIGIAKDDDMAYLVDTMYLQLF